MRVLATEIYGIYLENTIRVLATEIYLENTIHVLATEIYQKTQFEHCFVILLNIVLFALIIFIYFK